MNVKERAIPLSVNVFSGMVWVTLDNQRVIGLEKATPEQQRHYEANPISVYWPDLEDGIDMEYFTGEWSLTES